MILLRAKSLHLLNRVGEWMQNVAQKEFAPTHPEVKAYKLNEFIDFWNNPEHFLVVAQTTVEQPVTRFVGVIGAILRPAKYNKEQLQAVEIEWYVIPEYRSNKVGDKLFQTYRQWAKLNQAQCVVTTMAEMPEINAYYKSQGFILNSSTYMEVMK